MARGYCPCARNSVSTSAYWTGPAAVPSARAHPRSLSVSASPTEVTSPSSTGSLLGLPREPKASSSFTSLPSNESSQRRAKHQNAVHHSSNHFASCSMDPLLSRSVSFREQRQQSLYGGAGQAVGGGHPGAPLTSTAVNSGRFVGAQHERTRYHPRGPCGTSQHPAVADAANDAAIRDGARSPSEVAAAVTVAKYSGVRVPPKNQHFTSLQHVVTVSLHHSTTSVP